jgi:hypothetical protein
MQPMPDLNQQLEVFQSNIDALKPGVSRIELQTDLDLVTAIIEGLPGRIAEAASWQAAYAAGAQKARARLIQGMRNALRPPPRY